jgi:ADP-dependent NAD(P)H-hydrate dehydratase / NAD(P)H-hydrate epimerase
MKVVTAEEMRRIDRDTTDEFGIPSLLLMERAGSSAAQRIMEIYSRRKVIVACGSGNNGGDGMVAARLLHDKGWDVRVFLACDPDKLKGGARLQYQAALRFGVPVNDSAVLIEDASRLFRPHTIIVDALFGTGLSKEIRGGFSALIRVLNESGLPIIALDMPSGISSDTGQVMGDAISADYTVAFGLPKRGHFLYPGAEHTGRLFIEDIGFPHEALSAEGLQVELLEKVDLAPLIPARKKNSHKGDYGHVLLVAGSRGKTGAAFMAAKACLRAGAGVVTIGIPESLASVFQSRATEEMTLILPDKGDGTLSKKALDKILGFLEKTADVIAIGPGAGVSRDMREITETVASHSGVPVIIDADGLNSLKGNTEAFRKARAPIILTPHPGEMARLMDRKPASSPNSSLRSEVMERIEKNRIHTAGSFATTTGVHLVLKGVPTVTASPDGRVFINPTGNPGMSTAGAGDVLTGMIAGFLGQGLSPLDACTFGVYMHGLSGDIAASERGEHSVIASDIIDCIPSAFKMMKS